MHYLLYHADFFNAQTTPKLRGFFCLLQDLVDNSLLKMSNNKRLQAMEKMVQQLRIENDVDRVPVSKSAKDLVDFCNGQQIHDYLVTKQGPNPFKPDKPCPVL